MKRLNHLSENTFLKLFFTFFSLCFLVAAFFLPDREQMIPGFIRILCSPTKASTNFFSVGGFCLYNGGFTANLVCILLLPILEHHFKTKQRLEARLTDAFSFE